MRMFAFAALALLLAPAPAEACGGPGSAYLHRALPRWIPADALVAEVEIELMVDLRLRAGVSVRGRVRRMIQGDYSGTTLIVRSFPICSVSPFGNGVSGFLVGTPEGMEDGELVVVPMSAPLSPESPPPGEVRSFVPFL